MKATVVYIPENNGELGIVAVEKPIGPVLSEISGWMRLQPGTKKGDTFDVPESMSITTELRGDFKHLIMQ